MQRTAHYGHGPDQPARGLPSRQPGSVRRTATTDILDSGAFDRPLRLRSRARDLLTPPSGDAYPVDTAALDAVIDRAAGPALTELHTTPALAELDALIGATVMSGFRRTVGQTVPQLVTEATPLHLLLDEIPGAMVISGYALAVDPPGEFPAGLKGMRRRPPVDVCSGWRADGVMMVTIDQKGTLPPLAGPVAPVLWDTDDPLAWHDLPDLPPTGMRRARRMDVTADGAVLHVDAAFRDTYRDGDGDETVVHEYTLTAVVRCSDLQILAAEATPRVLPWVECPVAARSAPRLVGLSTTKVREQVRAEFVGISTCTHLNDLLRSLGDVGALAAELKATEKLSA
jgi:hypothetical protein